MRCLRVTLRLPNKRDLLQESRLLFASQRCLGAMIVP